MAPCPACRRSFGRVEQAGFIVIMDSDTRQAVSRWVVTALPDVAVFGFAQIDLDNLTGAAVEPLLAVDAMRWALNEATHQGSVVAGMVVLPLEPTEVASHDCPEWPALLHSFEALRGTLAVPGIYILAPGHPVTNADDVEYTAPLPIPPELGSDLSGRYKTWRTAEDRARGWEHNRAVYLQTGS